MGKVVMLTGSPASGKSTLRRSLLTAFSNLVGVDYGEELLRIKAEQGHSLTYGALRTGSGQIVQPVDVTNLDEHVISLIQRQRHEKDFLLDSHAVTRESYGFRAVPFSAEQLQRLNFDIIVVLRCDPEITVARIAKEADGRRDVTIELAREHQAMQESLALLYSVLCGCPIYVFDTGVLDATAVFTAVVELLSSRGLNPANTALN